MLHKDYAHMNLNNPQAPKLKSMLKKPKKAGLHWTNPAKQDKLGPETDKISITTLA